MFEIPGNSSWQTHLKNEFDSKVMLDLYDFLRQQQDQDLLIYPPMQNIFAAFQATPLEKVKVVILGQDPYHGVNQAHGLSFSVPLGVAIPPSLRNICKEISLDLGLATPQHGNLQSWAEQGVFLLNSVLSVEAGKAASHQNKGWEAFTDKVIELIAQHNEHVVFLLWGAYAQKKGLQIDQSRHLVLTAPHPSPLSAHRGFFGCKHFSKANEYLNANHSREIDWRVT